ncbi:hypothetical protein ACQP00_38010 [Dactylosporangium sp. CS-047395]|uniref:hypothetical protein n=1 Tax=Dactylosporangium sp. CS-047395 TaxID=3239936 RepID=UPI003D8DC189
MSTLDSQPGRGRRWLLLGGLVALLTVGLGLGVAAAQTGGNAGAGPGRVACPSVGDKLPAVPAEARAEVDRNLALLDTQIAEANQRLATSQGQGGPNFARNAILGPLQDKRAATLDRIAIAIGRHAARPAGLESLAPCRLVQGQAPATAAVPAQTRAQTQTTETTTTQTTTAPPKTNPPNSSSGAIACPSVADKLPAVPAEARAEVDRNLALLDTQLAEAEQRLATSQGQGGPNFVDNAILGPLRDKRTATINRIATAIGRHAARPDGLAESLAACRLVRG